jgi:hypothetical protein
VPPAIVHDDDSVTEGGDSPDLVCSGSHNDEYWIASSVRQYAGSPLGERLTVELDQSLGDPQAPSGSGSQQNARHTTYPPDQFGAT